MSEGILTSNSAKKLFACQRVEYVNTYHRASTPPQTQRPLVTFWTNRHSRRELSTMACQHSRHEECAGKTKRRWNDGTNTSSVIQISAPTPRVIGQTRKRRNTYASDNARKSLALILPRALAPSRPSIFPLKFSQLKKRRETLLFLWSARPLACRRRTWIGTRSCSRVWKGFNDHLNYR